jgi:hypothetical protein
LPIQAGSRWGSGLSSPTGATSALCRDGDGDVLARAGIEKGQGHRASTSPTGGEPFCFDRLNPPGKARSK